MPKKCASAKRTKAEHHLQEYRKQLFGSDERDCGEHRSKHDGEEKRERQRRWAETMEDETEGKAENSADKRAEKPRSHGGVLVAQARGYLVKA